MGIIATISSSFSQELIDAILKHRLISAVRWNTGPRSAETPYEVLEQLRARTEKPIWVDLKCRQLRVAAWSASSYGQVTLNHEVEIRGKAKASFRGVEGWIDIKAAEGNKLYLVNPPENYFFGEGQSVNIRGDYEVKGYFTETDLAYIEAAQELGLDHFMLSFYEGKDDIKQMMDRLKTEKKERAVLGLKIESEKGVLALHDWYEPKEFIPIPPAVEGMTLVLARDDLMTNLRNPATILEVMKMCLKIDENAIAASHLFASLERGELKAGDFNDVHHLTVMGYKNFMLSDGICQRHFFEAVELWQKYLDWLTASK